MSETGPQSERNLHPAVLLAPVAIVLATTGVMVARGENGNIHDNASEITGFSRPDAYVPTLDEDQMCFTDQNVKLVDGRVTISTGDCQIPYKVMGSAENKQDCARLIRNIVAGTLEAYGSSVDLKVTDPKFATTTGTTTIKQRKQVEVADKLRIKAEVPFFFDFDEQVTIPFGTHQETRTTTKTSTQKIVICSAKLSAAHKTS